MINNKDWNEGLFQNQVLKGRIDKKIFNLLSYEELVNNRFNSIQNINDEFNSNYKKTILEILPNYEQELLKYSNNSQKYQKEKPI